MGSPNWRYESVAFAAVCMRLVKDNSANLSALSAVYVAQIAELSPETKPAYDGWRRKIRTAFLEGEDKGLYKFNGTNIEIKQPIEDIEEMARRIYRAACFCYHMNPDTTLGLGKDFEEKNYCWEAVRPRVNESLLEATGAPTADSATKTKERKMGKSSAAKSQKPVADKKPAADKKRARKQPKAEAAVQPPASDVLQTIGGVMTETTASIARLVQEAVEKATAFKPKPEGQMFLQTAKGCVDVEDGCTLTIKRDGRSMFEASIVGGKIVIKTPSGIKSVGPEKFEFSLE